VETKEFVALWVTMLTPRLIRVLFVLVASSSAFAQGYDTQFTSRQTAARIEKKYSVALSTAYYSLSQLLDIEARLGTAARIKRNFGLVYDYSVKTLSELLDIEARLSTAARIKRNFNIDYDWQRASLRQLLEAEISLSHKTYASKKSMPAQLSPPQWVPNGYASQIFVEGDIEEVSDDGATITLADRSIWKVSPLDQIDTALWLPITHVRIVVGDDPSYPYKMISKDDGEMANVKRFSY
jgi:hypothetical protein